MSVLERINEIGHCSIGEHLHNAAFRNFFSLAMTLKPPRDPEVFQGRGSSIVLCECLAAHGSKRLQIITSSDLVQLGLLSTVQNELERLGVEYFVFDGVEPNPSLDSVKAAISEYEKLECDSLLAFGGGSVIDAAKGVALQVGNKVPIEKLLGLFRARKAAVPFYVIPTTAGTGSEVTSAAVLSMPETHQKVFLVDHKTIPLATALDPKPMATLPASITADTGMDVLTHAVEAYLSRVGGTEAMELAAKATKLVFENLPRAHSKGSDLAAREKMALASFQAGQAFNRMGLGFVHAISHQLTAHYGIPHGRANAILLPEVLEVSLRELSAPLAQLSRDAGQLQGDKELSQAESFVRKIRELSESIGIPRHIEGLQESDYDSIIEKARDEAIGNYAVPHILSHEECREILERVRKS